MTIIEPLEGDILCARGGAASNHPGTIAYRNLVAQNRVDYCLAADKDKILISRSIVMTLQQQNRRFLAKANDGSWYLLDDKKCVEKTSQALREGQPDLKKKLYSTDGKVSAGGDGTTAADPVVAGTIPPFVRSSSKSPKTAAKRKPAPSVQATKNLHDRDNFNAHYPPFPLVVESNNAVLVPEKVLVNPNSNFSPSTEYHINTEPYQHSNNDNHMSNDDVEDFTSHTIESFDINASGILSINTISAAADDPNNEIRALPTPLYENYQTQETENRGLPPPSEYSFYSNDMNNNYENQFHYTYRNQPQHYQEEYQIQNQQHYQEEYQVQNQQNYQQEYQVQNQHVSPGLSFGGEGTGPVMDPYVVASQTRSYPVYDDSESEVLRKLDRELAQGPSSLSIMSNVSNISDEQMVIRNSFDDEVDKTVVVHTTQSQSTRSDGLRSSLRSEIMSIDSIHQEMSCMSLNIGTSSTNLEPTIKDSQDVKIDPVERNRVVSSGDHGGREMVPQLSHVNVVNDSTMSMISVQSFDVSLDSLHSMPATSSFSIGSPSQANGTDHQSTSENENPDHLRQRFAAMKRRNRRPQTSDIGLVNEEDEDEQENEQEQQEEYPSSIRTDLEKEFTSTNTFGSMGATSLGSWDKSTIDMVINEQDPNDFTIPTHFDDFDTTPERALSRSLGTRIL